jgi:hypothetical protein
VPIAYALNAALAALENGLGPEHILPSYEDMLNVLRPMFTETNQTTTYSKRNGS